MHQAAPHPALGRLQVLVGEWEQQAYVVGQPIPGRARTAFAWLEGGAFLVQHAGSTITGRWEKSGDGSSWEPDLDLTYTKVT